MAGVTSGHCFTRSDGSCFWRALCAALFVASVLAQVPRGVFSLAGVGANARDSGFPNADVTGIVIRQDWSGSSRGG